MTKRAGSEKQEVRVLLCEECLAAGDGEQNARKRVVLFRAHKVWGYVNHFAYMSQNPQLHMMARDGSKARKMPGNFVML